MNPSLNQTASSKNDGKGMAGIPLPSDPFLQAGTIRGRIGKLGRDLATPPLARGNCAQRLEQNFPALPHSNEIFRLVCAACGENGKQIEGCAVRCNVREYRDERFRVSRCARCLSIHTERVENLAEYYTNYPIRNQKLDYFSRIWYGVISKDLVKAGLKKNHSIVDYGCNQGLFLDYLKEQGYGDITGFDPFVERFKNPAALQRQYDWVISMDVIEHDADPVGFFRKLNGLRKSSGRLCISTPRAEGINLRDTEGHLHMLHVPYHVNILSEKALVHMGQTEGLEVVSRRDTIYMDSWQPGTSYALIASLMFYGGNDVDLGYEPPRIDLFLKHPSLFLKLFLGYFLGPKKRDHMTMVFGGLS